LAKLGEEAKASSGFLSIISAAAKLAVPALIDLHPGSTFVQTLVNDTSAAVQLRPSAPLIAEAVIWGLHDRVAQAGSFCSDPMIEVWDGHNHTSVCKATAQFRDPLDVVLRHA
jgi:hypothetical protein